MNDEGKNPHGEKAEDAAFGAHRAAREPFGAVQRCIRQVSFEDEAAVRHGVKERLAEIKTRVPSHNQPETAGTPQGKRENQSDGHNARCPYQPSPGFPKWTAPNEHESTIAAGQKPMLSASVYCVYPRNVNSSNKPTKTKKTAHKIPQRKSSLPCSATSPKEYPPKAAIKPTNTEISTNPMRQPCQNNFPKAPLSGNP